MQLAVETSFDQIDTPQNRLILTAVLMVFIAALAYYFARAMRRRADRQRLHLGIVSVGTDS